MIATEKIVSSIPQKDGWQDEQIIRKLDFISIVDEFDPSKLSQEGCEEFMRRNPWITGYGATQDDLVEPIERRLSLAKSIEHYEHMDLEKYNAQFRTAVEGYLFGKGSDSSEYDDSKEAADFAAVDDVRKNYKKSRVQLITAIGAKAVCYMMQKEYDSMTEEQREAAATDFAACEMQMKREREADERERQRWLEEAEKDGSPIYGYYEVPSPIFDKIRMIQKHMLAGNGKPLTQRDFAKLIEYPVQKYASVVKAERYKDEWCSDREDVETELLQKLIMICHANPYWLLDETVGADEAEEIEFVPGKVKWDAYGNEVTPDADKCVFAPVDVILQWIKDGKPMELDGTFWDREISDKKCGGII